MIACVMCRQADLMLARDPLACWQWSPAFHLRDPQGIISQDGSSNSKHSQQTAGINSFNGDQLHLPTCA